MRTAHANAVLVGAAGVLIRGAPGSGKTTLTRRLVAAAGDAGFAAWVSDDRVALAVAHGRLVASAPPAIAGLAEMRGRGIVAVRHEAAAVIRLVVDLVAPGAAERMPQPAALTTEILGVVLPRQPLPVDAGDPLGVVHAALAAALAAVETSPAQTVFACAADEAGQM